MNFKANFQYKPSNFQMDDCRIERVVELSAEEFSALVTMPLRDHPAVAANKGCMFSENGVMHCLLALGKGSNDGVLIESEGYNFPRYAAYVPGMRDIVNAEMDRAADFIVRQAVENTTSGSWTVYFKELEEPLGLAVREGGGFDSMLRLALKRRPEVAAVDMHDGCIETAYHPEYCQRINESHSAFADEVPEMEYDAFTAEGQAMTALEKVQAAQRTPEIQYPFLQGKRPLKPEDLDVYERVSAEHGRIAFCLDVIADEEVIFGRQLSSDLEDSYIQSYISYDEYTGQVDDTLDVVLRSPGGDEWFSCMLTPETKKGLEQKMDAFCMERYDEHLPNLSAESQFLEKLTDRQIFPDYSTQVAAEDMAPPAGPAM